MTRKQVTSTTLKRLRLKNWVIDTLNTLDATDTGNVQIEMAALIPHEKIHVAPIITSLMPKSLDAIKGTIIVVPIIGCTPICPKPTRLKTEISKISSGPSSDKFKLATVSFIHGRDSKLAPKIIAPSKTISSSETRDIDLNVPRMMCDDCFGLTDIQQSASNGATITTD